MNNIDQLEKWLQMAGFETYNKATPSTGRPYICCKNHSGTNSFTELIYADQPENTLLEIIFNLCKKVGRIQMRQDLNHMISIHNYE